MPKIITTRRRESEHEKALEYIKSHILFPSGLLGLIFMIAASAALAYQFMAVTYSWHTFVETVGLLLTGGLLGWTQTRYHQYLLREYPGYFAGRMRLFSRAGHKRLKKELSYPEFDHSARKWLPVGYLLGIGGLVAASALITIYGNTYYIGAFLMPWAGFFWAKMFFWRRILAR
jgi:hypothetical protein